MELSTKELYFGSEQTNNVNKPVGMGETESINK